MNPGKRKRSPSEGKSSRSQRPKFGGSRPDAQVDTVSWDAQQQQQHGGSPPTDPREGRSAQISAGPSTSRRTQYHRPPEREEGARWTAPRLRYILPAPTLNGNTGIPNNNNSTQGWDHTLSLRSGSTIGAGQITSTLGRRVEPTTVSTASLMSSQPSPLMATEDDHPAKDPDAVRLRDPYNRRTHCPPSSPGISQDIRHAQQEQGTLDGACSAGPSGAHPVGPIDSSTVYPYERSPFALPLAGHISRYSSLADALDMSLVRYNTTPSTSASSSSASLSVSSPSSLSSSTPLSSSAAPSSSVVSALSSSTPAPVSSSTPHPSSVLSDSQATPPRPGGHYPPPGIHDDIVAPSIGSSDDIEASTRGDSAPMDCGAATREESIPQTGDGSSQPNSSSSEAPLSSCPSYEMANDTQISMSGVTDNVCVNYSPTLSSDISSSSSPLPRGLSNDLFLSPRSIISSVPSSQSDPSPPQHQNAVPAIAAIANHNLDSAVPDVPPRAPNEEETGLRITQQHDSSESIDVYSPFASSDSRTSPAPAPSSSTSPPTTSTASSPPSSEPSSLLESHKRVHDAALLAWLIQNLNSAAFSGLIRRSFLVLPRTSATNIRMVHEAAQGHVVASEDIEEFMKRVSTGVIELAALGNYEIQYEDLEWFIPKGMCSCCGSKE